MGNSRMFLRGLFVAGLVAALYTYGLAAQSATKNQGATSQQNQTAQAGNAQQDGNQPPPSQRGAARPGAAPSQMTPGQMAPSAQGMTLLRTNELIGKQVKTSQGDTLGTIHDIVLTPDYQQVSYVALSSGAAFTSSSKLYAIPWQALRANAKGDVTTSITKDQLSQSPGFTNSYWPAQADARWLRASAAAGSTAPSSSATTGTAAAPGSAATGAAATPGSGTTGTAAAPGSAQTGSTAGGRTAASGSAPGQSQPAAGAGGAAAAMGQDVQMRRVTHLTGMEVKSPDNQDLGDIEAFAINASDGHVVYDIISLSAAGGAGEKFAAVPANAVRIQPQTHTALLNATRSTLDSVALRPEEFSKLSSPDTMQRLSQAFPAAPSGSAFGYVPSQSPQMQLIADQKTWAADGAHGKSFNPNSVKTIQGTVQSVGTFKAEGAPAGASKGLRLRVKTSDGNTVTVYAGPRSYAEQQNFFVKPGDEITIVGSEAKSGTRTAIVASQLKKGNQTLQLRDSSGKPLWTMGSAPSGPQGTRPGSSQKSGATGQSPSSSNSTRQQ